MSELLPCPFCTEGKTVSTYFDPEQGDKWGYASCDACGARGPEVRTNYDRDDNAPWRAEAIAAWNRRAIPAAQVTVKPLEWFEVEKYRYGGKYTSEGYTIRYIEGFFILDFAGNGKTVWRFPTLEAAKAAAQADYESRIRSALTVTPHDPAKVAAVVAALQPFASCADELDHETRETGREYTDDEWAKFRLLVSDYRRARAAVAAWKDTK